MRLIQKGKEPKSLVQHRLNTHSNYDNLPKKAKQELRRSLVKEQRGICCYCMKRIRPDASSMTVEHWHSQKRFLDEQLNYANLLASCRGGEGSAKKTQHCDTRKGDRDLLWNPANRQHEIDNRVKYRRDGTIFSEDRVLNNQGENFDAEINEVLNLNNATLKRSRKEVLDRFLRSIPDGDASSWILHQRKYWNGEGHRGNLPEFCGVIEFWIHKRPVRG